MGEPHRFRCVKVFGHPETQKLMDEAFKCMKDEQLSPEHFSEKACFDVVKKEKNIVYMFDVFEGEAFEHIVGLGCRVYGPMCILTCVSCNQGIPRDGRSVYNLAMKDVIVCCTNIDTEKRQSIYGKVVWMGGEIRKDYTEDVTHLIAGSVGSKKYHAAAGSGIEIMTVEWVEDVWLKSKLEAVHYKDEQFQIHRCPVFLGIVITVSGLSTDERKEVKRLIEKEGGRYSGEMAMNTSTHLVINEPKGQKYLYALKWNIHVVKSDWLYESIEKGFCQDEANYSLTSSNADKDQMKTSTPERKSLATNGMADLSNISMISMMNVNETKFNSTTMSTNFTQMEDPDPIEQLNLTKSAGEMFLDGCKIYLSGFRGGALEKLRKVINMGGGTRSNQITDNLTHVIVGERIDRDIQQIKALSIRPHVVTSQWICDCFNKETLLDGGDYVSKEMPIDPTTPKKKDSKKSAKTTKDFQQPSTSKDLKSKPEGEGGEGIDMDIMSQYLTKTADPDETRKPDDTTLGPIHEPPEAVPPPLNADDTDMTQDPNNTTAVDENGGTFQAKTFMLFGFEDEILSELSNLVKDHGGKLLQLNSRKIPDYAIVPLYGFPVDRTVGDIVTNVWLELCLEQESLLDCHINPLFSPLEIKVESQPLKGCVLSISGYAGTERSALMHIAEVLGATIQDCFLRIAKNGMEANTQLVVNAPAGSKYKAAQKWGIPAVSNRWLIACAVSGKQALVENYLIEKENEASNKPTTLPTAKQSDGTESVPGGQNNVPNDHDTKAAQLERSQINAQMNKSVSNNGAKSDNNSGLKNSEIDGTKIDKMNESTSKVSAPDDAVKSFAPDFSTTGDTEALLLGLNTQGDQNNTKMDLQNKQEPGVTDAALKTEQGADDKSSAEVESVPSISNENFTNMGQEPISARNIEENVTSSDREPTAIRNPKADSRSKDTGRDDVFVFKSYKGIDLPPSATETLKALPPRKAVWQNRSDHEATDPGSSQKENIMSTPLQGRVKELQTQQSDSNIDKDTPSKFLKPGVKYIPKFHLEPLWKAFETPEDVRAERAKRRSSIPIAELFEMNFAQAQEKILKSTKERQLLSSQGQDDRDLENGMGVLQGVIISVARKLAKDQSDLNELVVSLGGDYTWNYDKSCTHFIFQGRQNDTAKDFKMARNDGCTIVHPHWIFMCKEQNARVDESMYPHTFNPNLSLSVVSSKRTPLRTPVRSTRRNVRERLVSKCDESQPRALPIVIPDEPDINNRNKVSTPKGSHSVASRISPKVATPRGSKSAGLSGGSPVNHDIGTPKESDSSGTGGTKRHSPTVINLKTSKESMKSPDKSSSEEDRKDDSDNASEAAQGGSLEMREMLSRQLENVMAESKGKKKRRSKRLNCSGGQGATPEETSSAKAVRRTQDSSRTSNRTKSMNEPEKTEEEKESVEMAPSQSVQIVWDDPMGRMEQEKLAHKLERACSPTQDTNAFYDMDPGDAQYSESEGEAEIPVPKFEKQTEEKTTPKADKVVSTKTPTPEGPSIAFPINSKVNRITPPKPLMSPEAEERLEAVPPVFMLSGMDQVERDDYGVLVEKLGGKVLDLQQFDQRCSHLVISNMTRNEKLLGSIAGGKWVLHKSYFEGCRQENTFVQEELYEWGSEGTLSLVKNLDTNVRLLAVAARDWRVRVQEERKNKQSKCGAFCTWRVILCCDKKKEGNYKRLLEAGGAIVLNHRPPFTDRVDATHVLMDIHKVNLSQDDLEMLLNSGCLCLKAEFICAYLSDWNVDPQLYVPPEVVALKTVLSDSNESTSKKRKASLGEMMVKRSKRR